MVWHSGLLHYHYRHLVTGSAALTYFFLILVFYSDRYDDPERSVQVDIYRRFKPKHTVVLPDSTLRGVETFSWVFVVGGSSIYDL